MNIRVLLCAIGACLVLLTGAISHAQPSTGASDAGPLARAIQRDDETEVRRLLMLGTDPNTPIASVPPIVVAAQTQSWKALLAILESRETKVDQVNAQDETALMYAAIAGAHDVARRLIQRGAQVNRPGWTPLHYAATAGHVEMVKMLLEQHAYIDAQSPNKTTPLMMAARHLHPVVVRLLIEEGADPTPRNESGWTAADYLLRRGDATTAEWLRERAREFESRYGTEQRPKSPS